MTIYLQGYVIKYCADAPFPSSISFFSLYPPKKGWRYIDQVFKGGCRAPKGTELTPILSDGAIPVYAVDGGSRITLSIHRPKAGTTFFKTYVKLPEGEMLVENEGE